MKNKTVNKALERIKAFLALQDKSGNEYVTLDNAETLTGLSSRQQRAEGRLSKGYSLSGDIKLRILSLKDNIKRKISGLF